MITNSKFNKCKIPKLAALVGTLLCFSSIETNAIAACRLAAARVAERRDDGVHIVDAAAPDAATGLLQRRP